MSGRKCYVKSSLSLKGGRPYESWYDTGDGKWYKKFRHHGMMETTVEIDPMDLENFRRTDNPTLNRSCYWGQGCGVGDEIIGNRNLLNDTLNMARYNTPDTLIKNHLRCGWSMTAKAHPNLSQSEADHPEYFSVKPLGCSSPDNSLYRAIIFSPYGNVERSQDLILKAKRQGYDLIKPMYSNSALSFMKIVPTCRWLLVFQEEMTNSEFAAQLGYDISPILL